MTTENTAQTELPGRLTARAPALAELAVAFGALNTATEGPLGYDLGGQAADLDRAQLAAVLALMDDTRCRLIEILWSLTDAVAEWAPGSGLDDVVQSLSAGSLGPVVTALEGR